MLLLKTGRQNVHMKWELITFFLLLQNFVNVSRSFRFAVAGMGCAQPAVLCFCSVGLYSLSRQQPQIWSNPAPARRLFPEMVPHLPLGPLSCWVVTVPSARKKKNAAFERKTICSEKSPAGKPGKREISGGPGALVQYTVITWDN